MDIMKMLIARKMGDSSSSGGSSAGGGGVSPKAVNFYDYDGTLLHAFTVAEAQAMTELPELPTQPGLICQGWNWDLESIKAHNRAVDVGATYITDDGKTRIYIHLEEGRTSPMLGCCPNGTVTVDWGDGTATEQLTGTSETTVAWTANHNYAKPGDYVIALAVDGTMGFTGESGETLGSSLLRYTSDADGRNYIYRNSVRKVEIGNGVTEIDSYSFNNCYSLTNVVIPSGVESTGTYSFNNCYSLTNVVIPSGVTKIGNYTFNNCYSLKSVFISSSVTTINNYAFCYCHGLTNVVIPSGVTTINNYTFRYCYSLKSVAISSRVTSIGSAAFGYCHGLADVVIPSGVTSIGSNAFSYCYGFVNVVIPSRVTKIDSYAFSYCYGVKSFDFSTHTSVPTLSNTNAFYNIPSDCEIRVPAALYDEWIAATNWSTYAANIVAV